MPKLVVVALACERVLGWRTLLVTDALVVDSGECKDVLVKMGYLTALARCDLRGHLNYVERNLIDNWFQTLAMRIDRFHQTWMGRRASTQRWLTAFVHYYNRQQPNQALDDRTPLEEMMNR